MTPKAQQTKRKSRINAYNELLSEEMEQAREEREIYITPGPRLGDVVIRAEGIAKAYGGNLLYEDLTFDVPPGAIAGIIGPNGAGKSTLFRLIAGQEQPDAGQLTVGGTVQLAYVDQSRSDLNPDNTVWEELSGGQEQIRLGDRLVNSRAYVARFNFQGTDQQKKVGSLSGGERNRVHMAKLLKSGGNVLLLDEPTNDLDVETLQALEAALDDFAGCAVIISHDRFFLDRIATHILAFEGESQAVWYPGNYSEYEADRRRRLGAQADRPHRITYRRAAPTASSIKGGEIRIRHELHRLLELALHFVKFVKFVANKYSRGVCRNVCHAPTLGVGAAHSLGDDADARLTLSSARAAHADALTSSAATARPGRGSNAPAPPPPRAPLAARIAPRRKWAYPGTTATGKTPPPACG